MALVTARAQARVGLLGNPSDLYGGRGLGFAVAGLGASVTLEDAQAIELPEAFLAAGWKLAQADLEAQGVDPSSRPFVLRFESNVPFQSGLAGSSAILTAAFRAWYAWYGVEREPSRVAELVWATEVHELGIRAGALDRLVQAHEGLIAMDFREPFAPRSVERLDPRLLPPMAIAWHGEPGISSGDVHAPIYARWESGDPEVTRVMDAVAAGAVDGREALLARDRARFLACVDANLDRRAELFEIQPADRALIELGRELGAATKLPGSGGAVLFVCPDAERHARVVAALRERGIEPLIPEVAEPDLP